MTPALIERLTELHAASTPGEWVTRRRGFGYPDYAGGPIRFLLDVDADTGVPICGGTIARESDANMQLIAALHNALPDLLAELSRLRQSEAELRGALVAVMTMYDRGPKPRKLDDALSWRENDEKARAMARAALGETK